MSTVCRDSRITSRFHAMAIPLCLLALMLCIAFGAAQLGLPERAGADERTTPAFAPIVKDAKANAANLVLIVEFSDSPEEGFYNKSYAIPDNVYGYRTNLDYLMHDINGEAGGQAGAYSFYTYRNYLRLISKGKFEIASYFPQAYADGTHLRIRISMSAQDYINNNADSTLITQAIEQLMSARPDLDASIFDADKDGNVDNLLVIADLPKLPENISFTPHANTDPGATIVGSGDNKRTIRAITVLNGGGITSFDPSVAVHERLHTIGAADYYRGDGREGDPVSYWDIMAKGNSYSWPLAYTRERLGWVDIPEIQIGAAGTSLTLYAPGDSDDILGSKPQAAKIKLPLSTSEYFVIEYRKQGTGRDYNNPINNLDRYIGSSGLIVYRVNERYANQGNFRGNDFVYVFRPGEKSLTASTGEINRAAICTEPYTVQNTPLGTVTLNFSIGSLDPNADITKGAICYSNGDNSGLLITATGQTDNSITISVKSSPSEAKDLWRSVTNFDGSSPFTNLESPVTKTTTDGKNLYVLAEDQSVSAPHWTVYKHDGANWSSIGASSANLKSLDLAWFNGSLYTIGARINSPGIEVKRFDGSSWVTCANVANIASSTEPRLEVIGGRLYVLVSDTATLRVYELSGSTLRAYGGILSVDAPANPALIDIAGVPTIVTGSTSKSGWKTSMYCLEDGSWKETRLITGNAASTISYARMGSRTYVFVYGSMEGRLFEFDATGKLANNSLISQAEGLLAGASLNTNGEHLYLIISTANQGVIAYKLANGSATNMAQIGNKVYASSLPAQSCVVGDKLYVAIADSDSDTIAVRSHDIEASSTPTPDPPVSKQDIANATVSSIPAQTYTGRAITPQPVVTLGTKKLVAGTDYTITYANNVNVGTATITIKGMGNYTGTKTARFTIVKAQDPTPTPGPKPDPTPTPDPDPTPTPKPDPTPTPTPDPTPTPKPDPTPTPDPTPEPTPTPDPDPATPEIATTVMHRLYNPNSGEHFYTASEVERDHLVGVGWNYEGAGWTAPTQSNTPVYRLYNANAGDHHYTTSVVERDHLVSVGWNDEGIGWYSDDSQRVPLFRQYNPNAIAGSHNYTTSKEETDMLIGIGWHDEGIGWYGV